MKPKFGIVLPTRGILFSKSNARQDIIDLSQLAENYGYDAVWAGDSIRFVAWNQTEQLKRFTEEVLPSF